MKKFILIILLTIIIILIYPIYKFIEIQKYKSQVDLQLYDKLAMMQGNKDQYQKDLILKADTPVGAGDEIVWGNVKVRLKREYVNIKDEQGVNFTHVYSIVQTKNNGSDEWKSLISEKVSFCDEAVVGGGRLLCFGVNQGNTVINIIDKDGQFTTKTLLTNPNNIGDSFYLDGNILYFIFTDERFIWNLPIPDDAPHKFGVELLMVGELNIETLEFKEHVIKYDSKGMYPAIRQGW